MCGEKVGREEKEEKRKRWKNGKRKRKREGEREKERERERTGDIRGGDRGAGRPHALHRPIGWRRMRSEEKKGNGTTVETGCRGGKKF